MAVAVMLTALLFVNAADMNDVVPVPDKIEKGRGIFSMDKATVTYSDITLEDMANYLSTAIGVKVNKPKGNIIIRHTNEVEKGGYILSVKSRKITISGNGRDGVAAGIATLRQIIMKGKVECQTITDTPRFQWRGFMLDVSRHFFDKEEVMSVIDSIAKYKFNKFHWHLTDDEGWRVEIKKYPLLTQKGAWRKPIHLERLCDSLYTATKNPAMIVPSKYYKNDVDTLYGGYYTAEDIKEVVRYAHARGIDIIPEIDMPGHCLSAVSNYDGISCFENTGWGETFTSPMCPGKDKTLVMCKDIYKEIFEMFPYEYVHIGGDEVEMINWKKCPDCQQRIHDNGLKDEHELQAWFTSEMEKFFIANGRKMMGWDETAQSSLSTTTTIMWWRNWSKESLDKALRNGNDVIICPMFPMYLSQPSGKNTPEAIDKFEPLSNEYSDAPKDNVLGIQTCVWTERIPSYERLMQLVFPQLRHVAAKAY